MHIYLVKLLVLFLILPSFVAASNEMTTEFLMESSDIEYHEVYEQGSYQVLLSTPKRINNEITIEKSNHYNGTLDVLMTALPKTSKLNEGFQFYRSLLMKSGTLLFECEQRACGVSSYWANDILGDRHLTGRDSNQYYVAGTLNLGGKQYIFSVYLVTNSLRQNLAFIRVIEQSENSSDEINANYLKPDMGISQALLASIEQQLLDDTSLQLYVVSYTNKNSDAALSKMKKDALSDFTRIQKALLAETTIEINRITHQFVGPFYESVGEYKEDRWLRLFVLKP